MQISSNKQDFWKKLESMESTSYVGESLDGLVAVAILRLHEKSIETTMENISLKKNNLKIQRPL